MSNITLTEVPLITEEHSTSTIRYKIQSDLSFTKCKRPDSNSPTPFWNGNKDEWQSRIEGCVAAHHHNQVIIRTAACAEEPYVLSVVKVDGNEMTMVELDLAHLDANIMRDVVKTLIFYETSAERDDEMEITSAEQLVKITMVDSQANVLSLDLKYDTLVPKSCQHIETRPILSSQNIHPHNRSSITSTQVAAIDSQRLVFAITPFILCLNLTNQKVSAWSKESCLYNRRKSLSRVLKSAKGILVGKSGDDMQEEFVEESSNMASTAALCVFDQTRTNEAELSEEEAESPIGKVVCSMHSDGAVRMWTVSLNNQSFTYPKQMHVLYGVGEAKGGAKLPLPHMWSSSNDSLLIDGRCHTATDGDVKFLIIVGIRIAETVGASRTCSPLHLTALSGAIGTSLASVERAALEVPNVVDSMKAMDFVKVEDGWELRSLFSCFPKQLLTYGESIYASFCNNPERKAMIAIYKSEALTLDYALSSNSFDAIADEERANIIHHCNLMVKNELSVVEYKDAEKIDAIICQLDKWYLQRIFRSSAVQTVGMNKATDGTIRRALRQVIPPFCFDNDSKRELSMKNIELETAIMMRKWLRFDESRSKSHDGQTGSEQLDDSNPSYSGGDRTPASSIYSDFCKTMDTSHSSTPEMRDDTDDELFTHSDTMTRQIQGHQLRWKKLLLAISHWEAQLLSPVGFLSLPRSGSTDNDLLVRGGITTMIVTSDANSGALAHIKLDSMMSSMLSRIEHTNTELLVGLEAKVWQIISKAKLLYADDVHGLIEMINNVVSNINVSGWNEFYSKLLIILNTMAEKDVSIWLSSPLDSRFRDDGANVVMRTKSTGVNASVIIPNAVRLSKQYIAACRRLTLARYVCIIALGVNGYNSFTADQERTSLLSYLHTVGVTWACGQTLASFGSSSTGASTKTPPQVAFPSSEEHLASRPRTSSLCTDTKKISLLFSALSKNIKTTMVSSSLSASTIQASKAFVRLAFTQCPEGFPELAIVQPEYSTDTCRISLRLLAPMVAFPANDPLSNNRCNEAAHCLLSEVFMLVKDNALSLQKATELQEHASTLLKSCNSVRSDRKSVGIFLNTLNDLPEQTITSEIPSEDFCDKAIVDVIQDIFDKTSTLVQHAEVVNIVKLEKIKMLLRPWVMASYNQKTDVVSMIISSLGRSGEDPLSILRHSANVLLLVSSLVERVKVLEKHCAMVTYPSLNGSFAKVLNAAVNDVIEEIQSHTNVTDYNLMIEYPALWSAIFRYALQGHCWEDAFQACLSNPAKERQIKNFRRLVLAMVDAGTTGILLDKMIFFVVKGKDGSKDMDLYEVAAAALVEASQQAASDLALGRFASAKVDYRGCLYALHAVYGDWRRSCQALDFLGALSLYKIPSSKNDVDIECTSSSETKEVNNQIMEELVLAAVSSAQLIQLVNNPDQRYIVSGELVAAQTLWSDKHRNASVGDPLINGSNMCDADEAMYIESSPGGNTMNRLSRLYTAKDLLLRAKRMIALQTLQKDALSPENLLDILHSSDTAIIDALPRLGYFDHAISFSHCKKENKDGAKPQGWDVFIDAMSHMLCKCLAPVAVTLSRPLAANIENAIDTELQARPTMDQLRLLTGDGRLSRPPDSWQSEGAHDLAQRGALAIELLRLYTESFAAEDNSIAVDLAEALLDLDYGRAKLPCWLTSLIQGNTHSSDRGLFAKNGGNPTVLLNLYIKYGLYVDGCELVTSVLRGDKYARQQNATARLPEKGNIDFVPYEKIDILWNTIESYLLRSQDMDAKSKLLRSRSTMEYALEKHFQLMQVSEQGMLSARALHGR